MSVRKQQYSQPIGHFTQAQWQVDGHYCTFPLSRLSLFYMHVSAHLCIYLSQSVTLNNSKDLQVSKSRRSHWTSCLTYLEYTFSLLDYLGVDIFVNKTSTVMSVDLYVPSQSHKMIFCVMNHGLDDEDDDPCLSKTLLQVSDEFDSLSCLCDVDSFILACGFSSVYNFKRALSALRPNPHPQQLSTIACTSPTILLLHSKLLCGFHALALLLPLVEEDCYSYIDLE